MLKKDIRLLLLSQTLRIKIRTFEKYEISKTAKTQARNFLFSCIMPICFLYNGILEIERNRNDTPF